MSKVSSPPGHSNKQKSQVWNDKNMGTLGVSFWEGLLVGAMLVLEKPEATYILPAQAGFP